MPIRTPLTDLIENETFARLRNAGLTPLIDAILQTPIDGETKRSGMTKAGRLNKSSVAEQLNINQIQLGRLIELARCILDDEPIPAELKSLLPEGYQGRVENPPTTDELTI